MKTTVRMVTLALSLFGATSSASAHQIWLEQPAGAKEAKLAFGEFGENMRELSPGRLDKFVSPTATLLSTKGDKPLTLTKGADGFVVPAKAGKGDSIVVEDSSYPLIVRKGGGHGAPAATAPKEKEKETRLAWTPAARHITDFHAQPAKLTLDILPTGKPGELQVVYKGKPLPEAKVEITAASGWGQEAETDKDGKVTFALPWKTSYLVGLHHSDAAPGKRKAAAGEEAYDTASYSTTLTFVTTTGLAAPPAPPAKKPSPET